VNPQDWRGWWFAGFTSPKICGRLWLFYLARMEAVYASQAELWEALPAHVRQAKSTRRNRLGDVYQPNPSSPGANPWDAAHEEAGVSGVPMFVIGKQVLTGLQDRQTLEAVIEEERKTAR
jgi:hypothetical protein